MKNDPEQVMSKTQVRRIEQYKDRWSSYGANTGILEISEKLSPRELKKYEIFHDYDEKFLEKISADVSILKWQKNITLFEEGSYLDLAFFIIQGQVEVYLTRVKDLEASRLSMPLFDPHRTVTIDAGAEPKGRVFEDSIYHSQSMKAKKPIWYFYLLWILTCRLAIS